MSGRSPRWISAKKAPTGFTVTITGTLNATYGYVTIDGTQCASATEVLVPAGAEVSVYVGAPMGASAARFCWVSKDGTQVQTGSGTYTFAVETNTTLHFATVTMSKYTYYTCTITTS